MAGKITPFLMFAGKAEEAVNFYGAVFERAVIDAIERYGAGEGGAENSIKQARFTLNGQHFICMDSPVKHEFSFTPALSLFVDCENEAEIDRAFGLLSDGGEVLMPLDAYPFAAKFAWLNDRYGVSWQLSFAR